MARRKPPVRNPHAVVVWTPPLERQRLRYEVMAAICARIEAGDLIEESCRAEGITAQTARNWIKQDEILFAMYARAREESAYQLEQQALRIAQSPNPLPGTFDARLAVDTLKWAAAKRRPRVYSDRVEHVLVEDPRTMPREEVEAKVKDMRRRLKLA